MENKLIINELLPDTITKLNSTLMPPGQTSTPNARAVQDFMTRLIDGLGQQSAEAQGLSKVITTADKVRSSPSHIVYLIKDPKANNGDGKVIGMLKVGRKHLYLFDERDQVREVEPLCVLDFFVIADHQRHGYGRMLFDFMLQDLEMSPHDMPVDGPSSNMERFLAKNYGLDDMVRQSNNFSVSPFFFVEHTSDDDDVAGNNAVAVASASGGVGSGRGTPSVGSSGAVGRFTAPKPPSDIASIIHGGASYYQDPYEGLSAEERAARSMAALPYVGDEWDYPAPGPVLAIAAPPIQGGVQPPVEAERELEPAPARELQPHPRPRSLPVPPLPAPAAPTPAAPTPADQAAAGADPAARHQSQLTDRGYFDVKFYHNKLW